MSTSKKSNIKHHIHKYMSKIEFENSTKNESNDFFSNRIKRFMREEMT